MKKCLYKISFLAPTLLFAIASASGCNSSNSEIISSKRVIRILNAADYIYEAEELDEDTLACDYSKYLGEDDMLDQFVTYMDELGEDITCVYDTYDTNETMYNELMTGKSSYDVIVTSDYMVQKLISNDLIQPLYNSSYEEKQETKDIRNHVSSYLWDIFDGIHPKDKNTNEIIEDKVISTYSVPYMWGTVGVMYNPEFYSDLSLKETINLFSSWEGLYKEESKNSFSIKDSVRDVYAVSVVHAFYENEIKPLEEKMNNGEISSNEFNSKLNTIFNRCDDETLEIIKEDMLKLKANSFGFEVDSGKTDMIEAKIGANLAWSGDATWAIEEAESSYEKELYFSIPKEGSNIWFDAFCIPSSSSNSDLALKFIDFMSKPENAIQNMYSVGYTSAVSSPEMLDYVYENYDVRGVIGETSEDEYVEYNLSYFFKDSIENANDAILHADPSAIGRTLTAQYPEEKDLPHLCVMDDFGTQNEAVLDMWEKVRTNPLPIWAMILFIIEILIALGVVVFFVVKKQIKNKLRKTRRNERLS